MKTKNIYIIPEDTTSTLLKRATECCGGYHQTIAGALLKSDEWKAWYAHTRLFDTDETQECDCMSDGHFKSFMDFVRQNKTGDNSFDGDGV